MFVLRCYADNSETYSENCKPKSGGSQVLPTFDSAKRARSPETTTAADLDAAQPKSKRSKQAKLSATTQGTTKSRPKTGSINPATTQPVATEVLSQVSQGHPPPPAYAGNFDLYDMELPFLSKVYLPKGASTRTYLIQFSRTKPRTTIPPSASWLHPLMLMVLLSSRAPLSWTQWKSLPSTSAYTPSSTICHSHSPATSFLPSR